MEKNLIMVNRFFLIFYNIINKIFFLNKKLFSYIIIGIFSIFCELFLRYFLNLFLGDNYLVNLTALFLGIGIAFYLNFFFNFKILLII